MRQVPQGYLPVNSSLGQAEPRELLVSRTVKDLVAGSGIRFTDRGAHALKGLPDTWQLYAVHYADDA